MQNDILHSIENKFKSLQPFLNERTRRLWAATEAKEIGRGGTTLLEKATGITQKTIRKGIRELETPLPLPINRSRSQGAGRKKCTINDPTLFQCIDSLIDPVTRGDPESPLRWTCKSIRRLAAELAQQGHPIGITSVRFLLQEMEYSLQANRKMREGMDHPDRNEQFLYINHKVKSFLHADQPVISVDTKKKENLGNYSNKGREWHPQGKPLETNMHDFPDKELGKAIPYGVYDIAKNEGWVSVGISSDTASLAANSIRTWWTKMGQYRFPQATRLLITADAGGSNGYRTKLWKIELQKLVNDLGLNITVCHFPPGTSKWNKIEHRLFSFITQNWRGQPLYDFVTVVNLIGHTTTQEGLQVRCEVDESQYETGIKVTDAELERVNLKNHDFHGEWNYTVLKRKGFIFR